MSHKICYLSSEITPFASAYSLGKFSRKITSLYHEDPDLDIRLMMPKYGFISERKYILREVIRLKNIPTTFNGQEKMVNLKSAFIPDTRVQVYFMVDDEFFKPQPELIYKSKNGRPFKNNDMRFCYFSFVALQTLKNLFWATDFIFCNDWQSALAPKMLNDIFLKDQFYIGMNTVFFIHSVNNMRNYSANSLEAVGLKYDKKNIDGTLSAIKHSALTVLIDDDKNTVKKDMEKSREIKDAFDCSNNLSFNISKYPKPEVWADLTSLIKLELQKISK